MSSLAVSFVVTENHVEWFHGVTALRPMERYDKPPKRGQP
jgi:hypothetical protein